MAQISIAGDTSGSITLAAPAVAGTNTLTLPTLTATVAVNGPAFSVYLSGNQSISSSTATKIAFNTEEFDTASCFNNTGSTVGGIPAYAFLPNVAGYYQFSGVCVNGGSSISNNWFRLYRNGSAYSNGTGGGVTTGYLSFADIVYLNGTTDYVEFYGFITATSPTFNGGSAPTLTKVAGCLLRAA